MTKQEKLDAYSMRLDGKTLQEIGDKYGLTRERIRQILAESIRPRERSSDSYRYPGIGKWILDHGETIATLADKAGISRATAYNALSLKSKHPANLGKESIDKILKATGLTYEAAFAEK